MRRHTILVATIVALWVGSGVSPIAGLPGIDALGAVSDASAPTRRTLETAGLPSDVLVRMAFANEVKEYLLPYARGLSTYAGAYIDRADKGGLVILLTAADPQVSEEITSRAPVGSLGVDIRYVGHTERELRESAQRVWDAWDSIFPTVSLRGVGVDVQANHVRVEVDAAEVVAVGDEIDVLENRVGVPIKAAEAEGGSEAVCTGRDNCYGPMKAGIRIKQGSISGGGCTMAFHVTKNGDEQFLTAGHCGHTGSNSWYHVGNGFIGGELGTQYQAGGRDVMRVNLPDPQASDKIYGDAEEVLTMDDPLVGEDVCASLGQSNTVDCGTVSDDYTSWTGDGCGCMIFGGDVNGITVIPGDSGSPLYSVEQMFGEWVAVAIGVISRSDGKFAIVDDALDSWGFSLYTD